MEEKEFQHQFDDINRMKELYKDPVFVGSLIHRLVEERSSANALFKQVNSKLDALIEEVRRLQKGERIGGGDLSLLPEIDKKILGFVEEKGKVCAQDVVEGFGYRGQNAACARLNSLFESGFLEKARVGHKVLYWRKN